CRAHGVDAVGMGFDVGNLAQVRAAVTRSREAIGPIGGLACCAAIIRLGPVGAIDFAQWDEVLRVNASGVAYAIEATLPELRAVGRGASIVVVASTEGLRGSPLLAAYTASKHAVVGLVRSASLALAREGIRVNAVCAGAMSTPMMDGAIAAAGEAVREQMIAAIPLGYIAEPHEVGRVIRFLLSSEASYVTGVALPADGGMLA
ncbi:MAG TPA: SDR family oxidoreductase, partial [Nevskiaceae bacterium]|nr:SDR family oxidoreductase [Nevskiaceae bacterium]